MMAVSDHWLLCNNKDHLCGIALPACSSATIIWCATYCAVHALPQAENAVTSIIKTTIIQMTILFSMPWRDLARVAVQCTLASPDSTLIFL